jgi:DnaJ like chaperone protein
MSSAQVVVVIFGLIVGYFIVAKLIDAVEDKSPPNFRKKEDNSSTTQNESDSVDESKGTWFAVLGVPEHSSIEEIHAAYRKLMSQYHPDRVASLGVELRELAEKKAKEINAAYDAAQKVRGR